MLKLKNINKHYAVGDGKVIALKDINLEFRRSEFVSILGASGSGKTTMLNIIGGLDRYTSGDLLLDNRTTKEFKDSDWDAYRNDTIGFIFQNYHLIPHLSVLGNVELAMTLSGVSKSERRKRAISALKSVGLEDQIGKRPNQMSGGQMQRVAIARALVNDPKVILADEPTGALDSVTSVQIMDILKEISKERLVIMVTHNDKLANTYSSRIIKLFDGEVEQDTMPYSEQQDSQAPRKNDIKKSRMSFATALMLSFNNMLTKSVRTIITSIAGSVGIIGVALVLAISNGMTIYINSMQSDMLSGLPITITPTVNLDSGFSLTMPSNEGKFPEGDIIIPYDRDKDTTRKHANNIDDDYIEFLDNMDASLYNSISYNYQLAINAFVKHDEGKYHRVGNLNIQQLPPSDEFVDSLYDIIGGSYPEHSGEAVFIVDDRNRIDINTLTQLGVKYKLGENLQFSDIIGREIKVVYNDGLFKQNENTGLFTTKYNDMADFFHDENGKLITISGILRIKPSTHSGILSRGVGYLPSLTDEIFENNMDSAIVNAQKDSKTVNVATGTAINPTQYENLIKTLGGNKTPIAIIIYPKTFDAKDKIKTYLNSYNTDRQEQDAVMYTDISETIIDSTSTLIKTITTILAAFAAISLVVSSIMIGIITYVSVVERTKEIGVLRSLGARKKDISRVFNAETVIIGGTAGVIGVITTLILSIPINMIIYKMVMVNNIARLSISTAIILIIVSMTLTLIAGLIPSRIAAKKDPVNALRSD